MVYLATVHAVATGIVSEYSVAKTSFSCRVSFVPSGNNVSHDYNFHFQFGKQSKATAYNFNADFP